jgi:hypothetical protein
MSLNREEMETLFRAIAEHIDRQRPADRERFLTKALFLLADGAGDLAMALKALDDAAAARDIPGTSRATQR